ncbi:hypothetical protein AB0I28_23080 [Phytomonospora sp. NPDC050363]|uniref:hypothetical protein n=1 Tax=Phytomonospora sp. NPDC050363 TaxID=3155642 RepID=UPI0033DCF39D
MSIAMPERDPHDPDDPTTGPDEETFARQERSEELPDEELPGYLDPERDNPEEPGNPRSTLDN